MCPALSSTQLLSFIVYCKLSTAAIQSGPLTQMLTFSPSDSSMCIDFTVDDDIIALEDPEQFVWTLAPVPIPDVELGTNSTKIVIIDDDGKYIKCCLYPKDALCFNTSFQS